MFTSARLTAASLSEDINMFYTIISLQSVLKNQKVFLSPEEYDDTIMVSFIDRISTSEKELDKRVNDISRRLIKRYDGDLLKNSEIYISNKPKISHRCKSTGVVNLLYSYHVTPVAG